VTALTEVKLVNICGYRLKLSQTWRLAKRCRTGLCCSHFNAIHLL